MLVEGACPLEQRFLILQGKVSKKSLALTREGLPTVWNENTIPLFVSYAYADLPLGKQFTRVFPAQRAGEAVETLARVIAVTQQFNKPFDEIPDGWKTITLFEFPRGIPEVIDQLPTVDGWGELPSDRCLWLTNEETTRVLATGVTIRPDFSNVDLNRAQVLSQEGTLVPLLLLPTEFGGKELPENLVYVPPFVLEQKRRIDLEIVAELVRKGQTRRYEATPRYQGSSVVPLEIRIRAFDPGKFESRIPIWGDALIRFSEGLAPYKFE